MPNNSFIRSKWFKFKDYQIIDNKYIMPKAEAGIVFYDPIVQNNKFKKKKLNEMFTDLRKINEGQTEEQKQRLAIKFLSVVLCMSIWKFK